MLDILKKLLNPGPSTSEANKLDFTDLVKLVRVGMFIGLGGTLTYILANLHTVDLNGPDQPNSDPTSLIIMGAITVVLELLNRAVKGNIPEEKKEDKNNG